MPETRIREEVFFGDIAKMVLDIGQPSLPGHFFSILSKYIALIAEDSPVLNGGICLEVQVSQGRVLGATITSDGRDALRYGAGTVEGPDAILDLRALTELRKLLQSVSPQGVRSAILEYQHLGEDLALALHGAGDLGLDVRSKNRLALGLVEIVHCTLSTQGRIALTDRGATTWMQMSALLVAAGLQPSGNIARLVRQLDPAPAAFDIEQKFASTFHMLERLRPESDAKPLKKHDNFQTYL